MGWQLSAALRGDLQVQLDAIDKNLKHARTGAMRSIVRDFKGDLRAQYSAAGLGRLAYAWRGMTFAADGGGATMDPVGFIYGAGRERTKSALAAHGHGVTIRGKTRRYLSIAMDGMPKKGRDGRPLTPQNWDSYKFGELIPVRRPGGIIHLWVRGQRLTKGGKLKSSIRHAYKDAATSSIKGGNRQSILAFVLTPIAKLRKRADIPNTHRKYSLLFNKRWVDDLADLERRRLSR